MKYTWYTIEGGWDNRKNLYDEYIGCCRVGDICFDLMIRGNDDIQWISYDCYIGGVDDGYGYGIDNYPYTYGDGGDWPDLLEGKTFAEFKEIAEKEFTSFIVNNHLEDKANQELHIW